MNNKKILILIILLISTLSIGDLYRTDVDTDYGFYQVRNLDNPTSNFSYIDKTLNINVGDSIEWINVADPDEKITLDGWEIVDENTFGGIFYNTLRWNYQKYSYIFNKSGTYRIHIDEYPRLISQTIVVKELYVSNPELIVQPEVTIPSSTVKPDMINSPEQPPIVKSPGFEFIFAIFVLIFLARKYETRI